MTEHNALPEKWKRRLTPALAQRRLVRLLLTSDQDFNYEPQALAQELAELVDAGANVNLVMSELAGAASVDYAAARNLHDWIAPLVRAGAKIDTGYKPSLEIARRFESTQAALELLACGARMPILPIDPEHRAKNLLHHAVELNHARAVRALIDQGFALDLRDVTGDTALMRAFAKSEIFRMLVEAGADVHVTNDNHCAAIDLIIRPGLQNLCSEQLLLLLDRDVDLDAIGPAGIRRIDLIRSNEFLATVVRSHIARKQALQVLDEFAPQGAVGAPLFPRASP